MSLIIAATDFSNIGKNAVNYACGLASAQNAQLIIVHSYLMPIMFSDVPMPATMINDTQHDAESQMDKLVNDCSAAYPDVNMEGKVVYGDIVDVIDEYSEEHIIPQIIVVGNSSAAEINTWPDSTLYETFKKVKYPVLAVPPGATFKPVQKLCFAFDNKHAGNHNAFSQLRDITGQLNAELHVLNIQANVPNQDNKPDFDEDAKTLLTTPNTKSHFLYETNDINLGIETFIEKNNMDILAMIPRKHTFFEGLFHKSHTKALAHHSHIPVLALHDDGE